MFRLLYELQNIRKERPMHVKDQLFIRGYAENLYLPVFLTDAAYLPVRYGCDMPVTAKAYIARVHLEKPVSYRACAEGDLYETDEIIIVGGKFMSLPRKEQRVLLTYEWTKYQKSAAYLKVNMDRKSDCTIMDRESDARYASYCTHGKAAGRAFRRMDKLDRKGQIATGKTLRRIYRDSDTMPVADMSIEELTRNFVCTIFADTDTAAVSEDMKNDNVLAEAIIQLEQLIADFTEYMDTLAADEQKWYQQLLRKEVQKRLHGYLAQAEKLADCIDAYEEKNNQCISSVGEDTQNEALKYFHEQMEVLKQKLENVYYKSAALLQDKLNCKC